ncbi:hypothetical protein GUITHDRAFT_149110 [Guillardia theta CCMP2712]|uniref:Uncharacterized protein n=1 Tax=Guillardia theta (strain CCMP2712) TaxID=905079 RepID=L1I6M0_GUITC|nr:hypothetical protein GUITHDRAFT_149110 [Guillardia theta CCMP2712]EKX31727.1 hypothetical protein GUITHDRAFT_149110 [Guillardia theta CCMP2712]|eukprot:XP_005818707.1 hypothetical protein GUITHDRAFT_149110 [Guillardia theta CCMP2712]
MLRCSTTNLLDFSGLQPCPAHACDGRRFNESCHGLLALRGGSPSLSTIPRSWPLKDNWTKTYGGKVLEVNGTLCYHFKYTPKMVKPKEEAIEYFKRRLKNRNVFQATIDECRDDPKKLEKLLDKILWTYDAIKRLKWFDFDIDPPAVKGEQKKEKLEKLKKKKNEQNEIRKRVMPTIENLASEWFDLPAKQDKKKSKKDKKVEEGNKTLGSTDTVHETSGGKTRKTREAKESSPVAMSSEEADSKKLKRMDVKETNDEDEDVEELCEKARHSFEDIQNFTAAEMYYRRILEIAPDHVETLCNFALFLEMTQDEDNPEEKYEEDISTAHMMYDKAASLEPANVDVLYQKILKLDPSEATTLCNYGLLLHYTKNDTKAAMQIYERAFQLQPETLSDEEKISLYYNMAQLYEANLATLEEGRRMYERALAISPTDSTILGKLGLLFHQKLKNDSAAEEYYQAARYDEAEAVLKKAIEIQPDEADNYCNYGQKKRGKIQSARYYYHMALNLDPDHLRTLCNYGTLLGKHVKNYTLAKEMVVLLRCKCEEIHNAVIVDVGEEVKEAINDEDEEDEEEDEARDAV